ncbi:PadR family transcriptional regulator [Rhodococcus triatomae BKS 15-14]|nr:PadR family transcriptional regulator [Rhodococcus triatomae BKS 15-14]
MIEYLAEMPQRDYHLTELARLVGLDKSTCHPMLTELTRVGWLVKDHTTKTYRLGPRLIAIGSAARVSVGVADLARPAMERLGADIGGMVCLVVASGDALTIADVVRSPRPGALHLPVQAGDRIEFVPPLGSVFAAFAGPHALDEWVRRIDGAAADHDSVRSSLRTVRRRRFAVELLPHPPNTLREKATRTLDRAYGTRRAERMASEQRPNLPPTLLLGEIENSQTYAPMSVSAACFDATGRTACAISVLDLPGGNLSGLEVGRLGQLVVAAADEVTRLLGGSAPR